MCRYLHSHLGKTTRKSGWVSLLSRVSAHNAHLFRGPLLMHITSAKLWRLTVTPLFKSCVHSGALIWTLVYHWCQPLVPPSPTLGIHLSVHLLHSSCPHPVPTFGVYTLKSTAGTHNCYSPLLATTSAHPWEMENLWPTITTKYLDIIA